ncbi:MAG: cupin domain-containing protein [Kiritimatiellia bacterium]
MTTDNYSKTTVSRTNRAELHDVLALTGAEISFNTLPAGTGVPFVHTHRQNEEIYLILSGKGIAKIDGEEIPLAVDDALRIVPSAKRQFFAAPDTPLSFVCIQVKANSLDGYTMTDAVIC